MEIGYYPGCSLESTAKEFDLSIRAIFKQMNISLKDIPDWNCCGASPAHYLNEELAKASEAQGRIHTSTVTMAILPEAEEVDIHIDPNDLHHLSKRATQGE